MPNLSGTVGGVQKQTYILGIELAKIPDLDVHFCVADFGQEKDIETFDNIKVWKSFDFKSGITKRIKKFTETLKKIDADTYIFSAAETGVFFATFYIRNFLKKKVLYMLAHDAEANFKDLKEILGLATALTMPYVFKRADLITAQSDEQFSLFENQRKRKPDAVIKYMIETDVEPITKTSEQHILWVGRIDKFKQPDIFVELSKKYPQEKFVMIAPIVPDFKEFGENFRKENQNLQNLQIIDYVKPDDIHKYYADAKIYVMTSTGEGFSNAMMEAMLYSCPLLSYKVNSDRVITKHNTGLWANSNKEKFYQDFEKLINNIQLINELGANSRNYIVKNHDKSQVVPNFAKLF